VLEDEDDPAVACCPAPQEQEQRDGEWISALCEWHVLWSSAFGVPVIHYCLSADPNSPADNQKKLTFATEMAYSDWLASTHGGRGLVQQPEEVSATYYVTNGEHPVLGMPFWFLHPCKTAAFMEQLLSFQPDEDEEEPGEGNKKISRKDHYLASWISWAGPMVGLKVDVSKAFLG